MKKWIFFIIIVIVCAITIPLVIYKNAVNPKEKVITDAINIVKNQTSIEQIDETSLFNGQESYVVVQGKNKYKDKVIAWIPSGDEPIVTRRATEGITKEKAISILKKDRNPNEIIKAVLGMEKGVPFWEITYIDSSDLYSFYYIDFETGEPIKRYALPK
ncbi:MAG: DUF5590 domain-containing protein [Bacillaceae bacterium]